MTVDPETFNRVRTALNCGSSVEEAAAVFDLPRRVVRQIDSKRHLFRQVPLLEGSGRVLHGAAEDKWSRRPARAIDSERRNAARTALEQTLKKFGLSPRDDSITVVAGAVPVHGSWHRKKARRKP